MINLPVFFPLREACLASRYISIAFIPKFTPPPVFQGVMKVHYQTRSQCWLPCITASVFKPLACEWFPCISAIWSRPTWWTIIFATITSLKQLIYTLSMGQSFSRVQINTGESFLSSKPFLLCDSVQFSFQLTATGAVCESGPKLRNPCGFLSYPLKPQLWMSGTRFFKRYTKDHHDTGFDKLIKYVLVITPT